MKRLIMILTLLSLTTDLSAQTYVCGDITGTWIHENSPYIMTCDINVVDSLIVEPGVRVQVGAGGFKIEVGSGDKFIARGTEADTIIFEPYLGDNPGSWNGISLNNTADDDTLEYCLIRHATNGVYAYDSEPSINKCTIYGNSWHGVSLSYHHDADSAMVSNCSIFDNGSSGVKFQGYNRYGPVSATCDIYRCTIHDNSGNGVLIFSGTYWGGDDAYAKARITNCTICNNDSTGIRAYAYRGYADASIINSIIAYNDGYGVANQDVRAYIGTNDINYCCFWHNTLGDFSPDISSPGFGENWGKNCNKDSCDINYNIYYDPLFVDTANADYHLQEISTSVNAGHPIILAQKVLDSDSTLPDIGAFYFHVTTGDANGDGRISLSDVVYLINYCFKGGPAPVPIETIGDPNCDCKVTISDIVYLINYLFKYGSPPSC